VARQPAFVPVLIPAQLHVKAFEPTVTGDAFPELQIAPDGIVT
jgi:hypothetical protein